MVCVYIEKMKAPQKVQICLTRIIFYLCVLSEMYQICLKNL